MSQEVFGELLVNYSCKHGIYRNPKTNFLLHFRYQVREVGPNKGFLSLRV